MNLPDTQQDALGRSSWVPALAIGLALACAVAVWWVVRPGPGDEAATRAALGQTSPAPGAVGPTGQAGGGPVAPFSEQPADQPAEQSVEDPSLWTARVDRSWVTAMAQRTGIPVAAMRAYAEATVDLPSGCTLGWNTLAGVGWVESQHGTIGGRTLAESGVSDRRVIGPALDGTGGFAAIRTSPEGTAHHGDTTWDHAVGPMQFIDSTWQRWGRDGDGDAVADPFDIDDATATAAAYLCADGRDLTTPSGWSGAILSYNRDPQYVQHVLSAANEYAARAN